jgi:hypothetical protein
LDEITRRADGKWACRFLSSIDPRVAQVKLQLLLEEHEVSMDPPDAGLIVFRKTHTTVVKNGFFGSSVKETKWGLEVEVQLPDPGQGIVELMAIGSIFGDPPPEFPKSAEEIITKLLDGIRRELNNLEERRKSPRLPTNFPVTLFALHPNGQVEAAMAGRCRDISEGGLSLLAASEPVTRHFYVSFDNVAELAGLAVLVQVLRTEPSKNEFRIGCRFRLDFVPENAEG